MIFKDCKMMLKCLPVAILVFVLVDTYLAQVPAECKKPEFAEKFDVNQLAGDVWYHQRIVNSKHAFDRYCMQTDYVVNKDDNYILKSVEYFKKTKEFTTDYYKVTQVTPECFLLHDLKDDSVKFYIYANKYGDNMLIESFCFIKNDTFVFQGYVILSKQRDGNKKAIDDLVKKLGIEVVDSYDYPQDNCFKYLPKI